jgi:hypothetical protein
MCGRHRIEPCKLAKQKQRDRQRTYIISLRRVYATIVAVENNKYSLSVLAAFGIQYAMRMRYSVVCGLSGCTVIFHIYLINGTIFGGEKLLIIKCVFFFIFSTTFV